MSPSIVRRHKHGARDSACAPLGEGHARGQAGVFGVRRRRLRPRQRRPPAGSPLLGSLAVPQHPHPGAGLGPVPPRRARSRLRRAPPSARRAPATRAPRRARSRGTHGPRRSPGRRPPRPPTPTTSTSSSATSSTARTCNCGPVSGRSPTASTRAPPSSAMRTSCPDGRPGRYAGEKIQPMWIFVRVHHPGRPRVRVHGQEQLAALVPRLHQEQRRTRRRPVHMCQIRVACPVPDHLRALPVEVRRRRAVRPRCPFPPPDTRPAAAPAPGARGRRSTSGDRSVVHARHEQPVRLRRPPETARTAHLLGRDELGQAVGDVSDSGLPRRAPGRPRPRRPTTRRAPPGDIRDVPAVGGGARVDHRAGNGQFARRAGSQFGREKPP